MKKAEDGQTEDRGPKTGKDRLRRRSNRSTSSNRAAEAAGIQSGLL